MVKRFVAVAVLACAAVFADGALFGHACAIRLMLAEHLFDITGGFNAPSDVAVSPEGMVYIVDGVNHRVVVFDDRGRRRFSFGARGNGPGQLESPLGIDIAADGSVYIADTGNRRIQKFSADGKMLRQIELPPMDRRPADPVDVALAPSQRRCYVADNDNHRILAVDLTTGGITRSIGEKGTGRLQFRYPFLMAVDAEATLYAVDVINTRVQAIAPSGEFLNFIGGWGVEKGELYRPKGVAVDGKGRVLVSDSYLGVVQVFTGNGTFYAALGDLVNRRVLKFRTPVGMAVDLRGRIYVVEMLANKVSVYKPAGEAESY
jgi:DNA-binding beta-propeller fold protein YncE